MTHLSPPTPMQSSDNASPKSFADHEPGLWRAVITQALMDAASLSQKPDARKHRQEAIEWLMHNNHDFITVCDNAGFEPAYVRSMARHALARGCHWRLPTGLGWRTQARMKLRTAHYAQQVDIHTHEPA
jgi:hypothetical protein